MNLKRLLPLAVVAALAALPTSGAAAANPLAEPCLTVPADTTLWLGRDIPKVEANSGSLAYRAPSRPCRRFVVDIQVPFDSTGGPGFTPAFSIETTAPFYGSCELKRKWEYLYRKNPNETNFDYLGHVGYFGAYLPNGSCEAVPYTDHNDPWPSSFDPPEARVATYRVMVTARSLPHYFSAAYTIAPKVTAKHLRVL